jgi:cytochrome c oxidase subunit 2
MKNLFTVSGLLAGLSALPALAQEQLPIIGAPVDREMGFQPAATPLAENIQWLDGMLLIVITIITLFVTGLLIYAILRFNRKANPVPGTFTHNTGIEIAWTVIPIVVLVFIGAFSLPVLFQDQEIPEADVTIKVTGYQWYWEYEYIDDGFDFPSYMIDANYEIDDEAAGWGDDQPMDTEQVLNDTAIAKLEYFGYSADEFLLATDTAVVVPVGKTVVMQVTGADVIHSWTIPAFGVKQDGVPGRLAELWFEADKEGIYFGQCSELCGKSHAYMPITVQVVSQATYDAWIAQVSETGDYIDARKLLTN